MKRKIEQFLRRDINSIVAPGKRDTITRKGLKKQKRYLNDSLKSLHERFVKENTDNKVSYPTQNVCQCLCLITIPRRSFHRTCGPSQK